MKRPFVKAVVLRLTYLTLTFLIGVAGTHVMNRVWVRFEETGIGYIIVSLPNSDLQDEERAATEGRPYNCPSNALMRSEARCGYGVLRSYVASDGVGLVFECVEFPSVEDARLYFGSLVKQSSQIHSREFVRDREGRLIVGERMVESNITDSGLVAWRMVCQDGNKIYLIASTSLRHVLIIENSNRRY